MILLSAAAAGNPGIRDLDRERLRQNPLHKGSGREKSRAYPGGGE